MKSIKYILALIAAALLFSACAGLKPAPAEETEIQAVVEGFGQKLKLVSLLSPTAAEDMKAQYSNYVSESLLQQWMGDPEKAPGRLISSPWPDRIEITSISSIKYDEYSVKGDVIELTSVEVNSGGFADKIPAQITLQKSNGSWKIVDFVQGKPLP